MHNVKHLERVYATFDPLNCKELVISGRLCQAELPESRADLATQADVGHVVRFEMASYVAVTTRVAERQNE